MPKKKRCEFCGYDNPVALMEHHQRFIVKSTRNRKIEWLKKEEQKIYVICANCHYVIHNILSGRRAGAEEAEIEEEQQL